MSRTIHNRIQDEIQREMKRHLKFEFCIVEDVKPHIDPYPGERDLNVVDILLRDIHSDDPTTYRKRATCLQWFGGNLWGHVWTPRKDDLVLVLFMENEKAIVFGFLPNHWQEPPCRKHDASGGCSADKAICYDYLFKWAKWRPAPHNSEKKPRAHPPAQHPDCLRGFHDQRDWQLVFDCLFGHNDPWCQGCINLDYVLAGSHWFKFLSDETDSTKFWPDEHHYHHRCGSTVMFWDDGVIYIENRVEESPKGHVKFFPDGKIELQTHSLPSGDVCGCRDDGSGSPNGARIQIKPSGEILLNNLEAGAYIQIKADGEIVLHSATKITLDAPQVDVDSDVDIGGDLSIGGTCGSMYVPPGP